MHHQFMLDTELTYDLYVWPMTLNLRASEIQNTQVRKFTCWQLFIECFTALAHLFVFKLQATQTFGDGQTSVWTDRRTRVNLYATPSLPKWGHKNTTYEQINLELYKDYESYQTLHLTNTSRNRGLTQTVTNNGPFRNCQSWSFITVHVQL